MCLRAITSDPRVASIISPAQPPVFRVNGAPRGVQPSHMLSRMQDPLELLANADADHITELGLISHYRAKSEVEER